MCCTALDWEGQATQQGQGVGKMWQSKQICWLKVCFMTCAYLPGTEALHNSLKFELRIRCSGSVTSGSFGMMTCWCIGNSHNSNFVKKISTKPYIFHRQIPNFYQVVRICCFSISFEIGVQVLYLPTWRSYIHLQVQYNIYLLPSGT